MGAAPDRPVPPGSPVAIGDVIAEKYQVEAVVAMGGMGIVVSARHLQLGQTVAIKVLLPSELTQEPNAVARFLREARAAAKLSSDHVVRIYDVGTLGDGLPFMVMELLRGHDLRKVVKTEGPLPVERAVDYLLQACDAVEEAHEQGIVHRDLKPSNLFLCKRRDGSELVKVLDFGISKALPDSTAAVELTTSSVMMGSPLYMSPEQVRDARSVDQRTDVWALGVILYQLLTAKPPFNGDSLPAVCAAIAADPPTPIERMDLPEGLLAVIFKCLAKSPDARFASVTELRQVLAAFAPAARLDAIPLSGTPALDEVRLLAGEPSSPGRVAPLPVVPGDADAEAETVSYNRLLANKDALRAPPLTDAPLAATLRGEGGGRRSRLAIALAVLIALGLVGTVVVLLLGPRRPVESSVSAVPPAPATAEPSPAPVLPPTGEGSAAAASAAPEETPVAASAPAPRTGLRPPTRGKPVAKPKPTSGPPPSGIHLSR